MPEAGRQRLFFALWPGAGVRRRVSELARRHTPPRGRRVAESKLHLTLAFLGEADDELRCCAEAAAGVVGGEAFTLELDRIGHFRRARVLWLGAETAPPALAGLHARLIARLARDCGRPVETRRFRPHVTLARKVGRARPRSLDEPVAWPVTDFVLVASRLTPEGARYRIVRRWKLDGGQAPAVLPRGRLWDNRGL